MQNSVRVLNSSSPHIQFCWFVSFFAFCFCVLGQNDAEMSNFMEMGLVVLGGGDGEIKQGGKKKFITREEEPEQ